VAKTISRSTTNNRLSSHKLTAAVSNFGGLESFGAHDLASEAIKDVIGEIRALTSKSSAMNLWVSMEDESARTSQENDFDRSLVAVQLRRAVRDLLMLPDISRSSHQHANANDPINSVERSQMLPCDSEAVECCQVSSLASRLQVEFRADAPDEFHFAAFGGKHSG